MAVTSADRLELVSLLAAFKENVQGVKERFYRFLIDNDPKGYAQYSIEAYPGGYPVSCDVLELQLEEESDLYFTKPAEEPSEFPVYMIIPDAYLDDPDAWEEQVLSELAIDREMAERAVKMVFDVGYEEIKYRTERPVIRVERAFVNVILDNDSIPSRKWIVFMNLTPLNRAVISVNRKTGAVFEDYARRDYNLPEGENRGFMGYAE